MTFRVGLAIPSRIVSYHPERYPIRTLHICVECTYLHIICLPSK